MLAGVLAAALLAAAAAPPDAGVVLATIAGIGCTVAIRVDLAPGGITISLSEIA